MKNNVIDEFYANCDTNPHYIAASITQYIAYFLYHYKVENKLTNEELSLVLGVSKKTVSQLLGGDHYLDVLLMAKLSVLLNLKLSVTFGGNIK